MTRFLATLAVLTSASLASAGGIVFVGSDTTDPTATADIMLDQGSSTELAIWWSPADGETVNGASVDILTSVSGILDATAATVFNAARLDTSTRFNGTTDGDVDPSDAGTLVEGMLGVSVDAGGLNPAVNDFFPNDSGFIGDSFLFGTITVEGLTPGSTVVTPGVNATNPITAVGLGGITVDFAGLTVTVPGGAADPMLVGTPGTGPIDLTDDFINRTNSSTADIVASNGGDGELGTISAVLDDDTYFGVSVNGNDIDLTLDTSGINLALQPAGTVLSAQLTVSASGDADGDLTYTVQASVPEPATIGLFGLGIVGLVGLRRRS